MFAPRFAQRAALAVAVGIGVGLAEGAVSEGAVSGGAEDERSTVEQIGEPADDDAAVAVEQADQGAATDGGDPLAIEQSPPEAVDMCAPEQEALRRRLGVECLPGETLQLPGGETARSDAVVVNEDGVFIRLDPDASRREPELKRLLSGN